MKEDTFTRTEDDARHAASALGRDEWIGEYQAPVTTPYCDHCQGGAKGYVCGPCERWGWS